MRFRDLIFAFFFFGFSTKTVSQCPNFDFFLPPNACSLENIPIENLSQPGLYQWDFCSGDFNNNASSQIEFVLSSAVGRPSMEYVWDGEKWFAFVTGTWTNSLYRIEYKNGINKPSTLIQNLGNVEGKLNGPGSIRLINQNGTWIGLIHNTTNGELLRLLFGNNLSNSVQQISVIASGIGSTNNGMAIGFDNKDGWVCIISTATNQFKILRLGNDLSPPTAQDILTVSTVLNSNNLGDIDLIKHCDQWFGFANNFGNGLVYRLSFGTNLFQQPTIDQVVNLGSINGGKLRVTKEGQDYFLFVTSLSGSFYKISLGSNLTGTNVDNEGDFGALLKNSYGLAVVKDSSFWKISVIDQSSGGVYSVNYSTECPVIKTVGDTGSSVVKYTQAGDYDVVLTYTNSTGISTSIVKSISISSQVAPLIQFESNNVCVNHDVNFVSINASQDIINYSWNFGDTQTDSNPNPTHQFNSVGDYVTSLRVTSINGCFNYVEKPVKIYNQPSSSFTLESGLICTNNEFTFVNNTLDTFDGFLTHEWFVDNQSVSTVKDLIYTFTSNGDHQIKLVSSIPGCSSEQVRTVNNVQSGPVVGFDIIGNCQGEIITFRNRSAGSIANYEWDLGSGSSSTLENPINIYSLQGVYPIMLKVTSTNGCVSVERKDLIIASTPQPNFYIDLPPFSCAGTPTQFHDITPLLTDGNIASWQWSFDDGSVSNQQNPQHTYAQPGFYDVTLQVASNFGCQSTIQIPIEISESPKPQFIVGPSCLNKGTQFEGTSNGPVSVWKWSIGNTFYGFPEPTHTFNFSGNYPATLTVVGINGCEGVITKNIEIKPVPLLDFSTSIACSSRETIFTDQTTGVDLPQTWQWNFEPNAMGEDSPASYTFQAAGAKPVKMSIVTQSGCEYSLTKNVIVAPSPTASFSTSETFGAPPLAIQFTNTSLNASGYSWNFGTNNASSTEINPAFTYTQLGEYLIELTATNGAGCSDAATQSIQVLVPHYNLSLESLVIQEGSSSNAKVPMVTITNNSNVPIGTTDVWVTGSSGLRVKSSISLNLGPGAVQEFTLPLEVFSSEKFICVELNPSVDADLTDNLRCENLTGRPVVLVPYPNPTLGVFWLDIVLEEAGSGLLKIADSMGKTIFNQEFENLQQGMNHVEIDFANQRPGLYIAIWSVGDKQTEFRFIRQ